MKFRNFATLLAISLLATASFAKPTKPQSGTVEVQMEKIIDGVRPLAFAAGPGSRFVASLENKDVEIINANTHSVDRTFQGPPQPAMAVAWSSDGELVAAGDESARIFVWNAETGAQLEMMRGHIRGIEDLNFNYARSLLLSTGKDDVVKIWNPETGKEIDSIPGKGINFYGATFRGKTSEFGVGTLGAGAREYNSDGQVQGFYPDANGQGVWDMAFNPSGTRAVTAGRNGLAEIWDTTTMKRLGSLHGHSDWVVHCAWSPNGKWIATSGDDRTVRIWNPYDFEQVAELDNQDPDGSPLCWTTDGKYLITVADSGSLQINSVTPAQNADTVVAAASAHKPKHRKHHG